MDVRQGSLPSQIGRFRIDALLGRGGMGEVYKAFDPALQRIVAIKTVRPDINNPESLERLYREAQACARLQHPNIVTVYEAGEWEGLVYIAMEYLKGTDLGSVLRRGELSFESRMRILRQILDALQHAHGEGVIHRDIKPSNVQILPDGSVKLMDFGLARVVNAESLTMSGAVMGTPHYASPEQLRGEDVDRRTDIYSTGVLGYEMLSGRRPFQGDNDSIATVVLKVISSPPPPLNVWWSWQLPEVERIITRAMAKTPAERYQSAEDMRETLASFVEHSRDKIAAAQSEANIVVSRTVDHAKELIAAGKQVDARALMTEVLQSNPDAGEVRSLLNTTLSPKRPEAASTVLLPRTPSAGPSEPAPGASAATVISPAPAARTPAPMATQPVSMRTQVAAAETTPPRSFRTLGIAAAAAALVIVSLVIWRSRGDSTDATSGATAAPATPSSAAATQPAPSPPATVATAQPSVPAAPAPAPASADRTIPSASSTPAGSNAPSPSPSPSPESARGALPPQPDAPTPIAATSAKQLFYVDTGRGAGSGDAARTNAGLRFRLVQQSPDGSGIDVDPSTKFRAGDRVRFAFESNITGHLYVVQQGSTGRWTVLFPNPDINGGRNTIKPFEQYDVPRDAWFKFDENPGTEQVFVFLSREPVTTLPGFDKPVTRMESVQASVVEDLRRSVRSRDLMLEKEPAASAGAAKAGQATYVVNREEVGKAVSAVIELTHVP